MWPQSDITADAQPIDSLADQLIYAAEALVRSRSAAYKERFQLTEVQYRVMMQVAKHAPLSLGELCSLVHRDQGQISRLVKSMTDAGLLTRAKRAGSAAMAIELSPRGRRIFHQMAMVGEEWEVALTAVMSPQDIALASQAASHLYEAAFKVRENCGPTHREPKTSAWRLARWRCWRSWWRCSTCGGAPPPSAHRPSTPMSR